MIKFINNLIIFKNKFEKGEYEIFKLLNISYKECMSSFCGIDMIEVERVKSAILNTPGFKEKVFTANEIMVGDKKNNVTKFQYYAGRFAAKEAVYKAISKEYGEMIWLGDIEILNEKLLDRPYVNILKPNLKVLENYHIDVSISHIKDYAIATAIAEKL